jgi:hypothetical protein
MENAEENKTILPLENSVEKESIIPIENDSILAKSQDVVLEKTESEFFEFTPIDSVEHLQVDYSLLDKEQIVSQMKQLLDSGKVFEVKDDIEELKVCFYKLHRTETEAKRTAFIADGGVEEDFLFEDLYEVSFKELYKKYKDQKAVLNENLEKEKNENLKKRWALIEELKELVSSKESVNKTFNEFKEIQQRWRTIGMVPQQETKNIWESYHHHVTKFYDFVKINNELRDLDLKKNLESKIEICEKAEQLILEESVIKAFGELQKLHEQWREIGPVAIDKKNELWERFKSVTTQINKRHQDYFTSLKDQEKANLDAKAAICEKIEGFLANEIESAKDWSDKTNEIVELQKLWKTIGFAPRKNNNDVYSRFRKSCDEFFSAKRDFFGKLKGEEDHNKQLRIDLCIQAEALQTSTDWKKATTEIIALQNEWKALGHISRKESDKLWKRFRAACDLFFNAKSAYYKDIEKEQDENLKKKNEIIEKVEALVLTENDQNNLQLLQDIQNEWAEIGFIPINQKEKIQIAFRNAINKKFESLAIDDDKKKFLKYKVKMETSSTGNRNVDNKISFERTKLHKRTKELTEEISLLENNIGFFSKSKNAESIINDQKQKIEKLRHELDLLHKQTKLLDEIERNEGK